MTNRVSGPAAGPTRALWGLITLLLLVNAGLVSWICIAPSVAAPRPAQARHPAAGNSFLADTLGFTASQRNAYDSLRTRYFGQVRPLTQSCRQDCQRYFLLLDSAALTDEQLAQRSRAALASKVAVDVATVRHLQQVAALCSPTQRQVLRRVLAPDCSFTEGGVRCQPGALTYPWSR